jgi:hypothetical protein
MLTGQEKEDYQTVCYDTARGVSPEQPARSGRTPFLHRLQVQGAKNRLQLALLRLDEERMQLSEF